MMRKRALITGSGRSGTTFISTVMNALGYDMRHEGHGPVVEGRQGEGIACWYCCMLLEPNVAHNGNVTRCGCRFPDFKISYRGEPDTKGPVAPINAYFDLVLHQMRSPLDVIGSLLTLTRGSWDFVDNKIGIYHLDDPVLRATRYWIEWNNHAAEIADYSYRLEDIGGELPAICDMIGLEYDEAIARDSLNNPRVNARKHPSVTAVDIKSRDAHLFRQLEETAASFGYRL